MAKALVKSPGRKAASRSTGTRAKSKSKSTSSKSSRGAKVDTKAGRAKAAKKPAKRARPPRKSSAAKRTGGKTGSAGAAKAPKKPGATTKPKPGATTKPKPGATTRSKPDATTKPQPGATTKPKPGVTTKSKPGATTKPKPAKPAAGAAGPKQAGGKKPTPSAPAGDPRGQLKERFAKLSQAKTRITGLKRSINKNFFDVGVILNEIRAERLYEVKGYGSFESFVEREIDLNKAVCLRSARIAVAITRDEAEAAGLERASAAVAALDGEEPQASGFRPVGSPVGTIPVHKR